MNKLFDNKFLMLLIICSVLDIILGSIRAIKERRWNSSVGSISMLRKFAMIISVALLSVVDILFEINLIGFIPNVILEYLNIPNIGISGLFAILFVLYELTSVFKNMVLCGLPIPKKLQIFINEILNEYTCELKDKNGGDNHEI